MYEMSFHDIEYLFQTQNRPVCIGHLAAGRYFKYIQIGKHVTQLGDIITLINETNMIEQITIRMVDIFRQI